jgi:hypothetical protein
LELNLLKGLYGHIVLKTCIYREYLIAGSPWGNSSPGVDEERKAGHQKVEKKNNVLPLWGNERTMNLNPMILTNIQSSHYFKGMKIWMYYFCRNFQILTNN